VQLSFFKDAEHTTPFPEGALATRTKVYVVAEGQFTKGIKFKIQKLVITTSTSDASSPKHLLIENYCKKDSTVKDLKMVSNNKVTFNFEMFEFASTQQAEGAAKAKLYFHPTFKACPPKSTAGVCGDKHCPSRTKRSVEEPDVSLIKHTFGPYFTVKKSQSNPSFFSKVSNFLNNIKTTFVHICNMKAFGFWSNLSLIILLSVGIVLSNELTAKSLASPTSITTVYNGIPMKKGEFNTDVDGSKDETTQPPPYQAQE